MRTLVSVVCAVGIVVMAAQAHAVKAGAAACDITPDVQKYDVPLAGYGARGGRPSTGVHDAIHAKVLYLEDGDTRMALITTDLRSVTPALKDQIVAKAVGSGLTRDDILLCASHNHSGPSIYAERFWQLQFGVYDPAIVEEMSNRIADAIDRARGSLFEAKTGHVQRVLEGFTRNRRWEYDQAAREASGETPQTNPRLFVLRVDDADGKTRGILINFATHPTILGADNFEISAEWPGVLQRRLEEEFPDAVALYTNGAEGDQSPAGAQGADDFARMEDYGSRLAVHAADLVRSIETAPFTGNFGMNWWHGELGEPSFSENAKKGRYAFMEPMALEALPRRAEVQVMHIGEVALAGLPGEPICIVGGMTEAGLRRAGMQEPIVIGLANDYIGYILDANEYAHGGYEVDQRSYYGPTLGERIAQFARDAVMR